MKPYTGFDRNNVIKNSEQLPVGAYVCKIISAKEVFYSWGSQLAIAFDIAEGEFAGYYQRKFDANTNEDKRWSGVLRLNIPTDDGSEDDDRRKRSFNTAIVTIEEDNPGYEWNWNEASLKGKKVGIVFNKKEFEGSDGKVISFTQPKTIERISKVLDGTYYRPKDQLLGSTSSASTSSNDWISVPDDVSSDELPFA